MKRPSKRNAKKTAVEARGHRANSGNELVTIRAQNRRAGWRDPITRNVFRVWRSSGTMYCAGGRGGLPTRIFAV